MFCTRDRLSLLEYLCTLGVPALGALCTLGVPPRGTLCTVDAPTLGALCTLGVPPRGTLYWLAGVLPLGTLCAPPYLSYVPRSREGS